MQRRKVLRGQIADEFGAENLQCLTSGLRADIPQLGEHDPNEARLVGNELLSKEQEDNPIRESEELAAGGGGIEPDEAVTGYGFVPAVSDGLSSLLNDLVEVGWRGRSNLYLPSGFPSHAHHKGRAGWLIQEEIMRVFWMPEGSIDQSWLDQF